MSILNGCKVQKNRDGGYVVVYKNGGLWLRQKCSNYKGVLHFMELVRRSRLWQSSR